VLEGPSGFVSALALLPGGRVVCASYDGSLRVWSVEGGPAQVLEGHTALVTALATLPDGRVVSASKDKSVRVWSVDGAASQVFESHTVVTALGVFPDGRVVSASELALAPPARQRRSYVRGLRREDGAGAFLRVWSLEGGPVQVLKGHKLLASAVVVLADGRVVSASWDRTVRVWGPDGAPEQVLEGHTEEVTALAVLPDGRVVSGSRDKSVRVWSLDGAGTRVLQGHTGWVTALAVLPDGRVVSGGRDKSVRVWSRNFEIQHSFIADDPINCLCVTPAGVIVAGCEHVAARVAGSENLTARVASSEYGNVHILRLPPERASRGTIARHEERIPVRQHSDHNGTLS